MEYESRKKKNEAASYFPASQYSNKNSEIQENYDHSNVGIPSRSQRVPDQLSYSSSARLNGNNGERKSSKKWANSPDKCPSSPESDNFANSIFEKSGSGCKKRKSVSKPKRKTVSICPLEISFPHSSPIGDASLDSGATGLRGRLLYPNNANLSGIYKSIMSDSEGSSADSDIENSAAELSLYNDESQPRSRKLPLQTKFPDEVEESVLNKVINRNSVEKSLLKLPLISMNISNLVQVLSGLEKNDKKRKQKSKVHASKRKIPCKISGKKSPCDYEFDEETEKDVTSVSGACILDEINNQSSSEEGCVNNDDSQTGTKTIARKSVKKKVKQQKKKVSFCESTEVIYMNMQLPTSTERLSVEKPLLVLPEKICNPSNEVYSQLENNGKKGKFKVQASRAVGNQNQFGNSGENVSLCDSEFDGETECNLISSSETYTASKICNETNVAKGSETGDTCTTINNRARKSMNKTSGSHQKKRFSFCKSIELDGESVCNNLRRSTRKRTAPLRNWCNERVRYRILENGDIIGQNESVSFCESIKVNDVNVGGNLRRSTRMRMAPLRPWCNERARYRILENGDIAFVDITDK